MSSPQDPNQPLQPLQPWGAPPSPDQPGWAAPPQPNQTGWAAPPPPNQPGWGAPPPPMGAPTGYGQPGWPPAPAKRNNHGCLIGCLVVFVLFVFGVGACTVAVYPTASAMVRMTVDLGPRTTGVHFNTDNGQTVIVIELAPGYENEQDAKDIACNIVRPDIRGTWFSNARFEIIDSNGDILADDTTPC
jgi:hypothetical protein